MLLFKLALFLEIIMWKGVIPIKKNVVIVLGNGFSIDLINHLNKFDSVDLSNLFKHGDKVPWPQNKIPGFLSYRNCPELWKIGARPSNDKSTARKIVDDIITCANVSAITDNPSITTETTNAYILAYHELVVYLRYLFIYYDKLIDDKDILARLGSWGWAQMFSNLKDNSDIESVTVITYNYDIFLERVLKLLGVDYQLVGFSSPVKDKFSIIKPHGSISFRSKRLLDREFFSIQYNRDSFGGRIDELEVDENVEYDKCSKINTMIPPSGESERYKYSWSKTLRENAELAIKKIEAEDDIIIGGLSYCSVDRQEIDKIITKLDKSVNIFIANPDSSNTLVAVISSIFDKYIHFSSSDTLGGLYK